ncbi:MAG: acetoacetate--CoA ligase, partial [Rhodoferax sp.]|nr:acetoacetate--CoA ligase [Rhodoferax sp.]
MHAPPPAPFVPQIRLYQDWLQARHGLRFDDYEALWRWSIADLDAFWQSLWDYYALQSPTPHTAVLAERRMPGARWFPGAQVNYARQALRHADAAHAAGQPAVISHNEKSLGKHPPRVLSWPQLRQQVASLALHLQAQGVQPGDRVAAYLPNVPEAIVAFLASASIGAVWSICAPDMGVHAVLDRFRQIEPKVLIACDGVTHGGQDQDRLAVVAQLRAALPTVRHLLMLDQLGALSRADAALEHVDLALACGRDDAQTRAFEPLWLAFDHPLWIVYSSGTTGLPKPIVHGHGGSTLVTMELVGLHNDVGASYLPNSRGERYHWYSSTGWVMWNAQVSGLLLGATCCIFDGSPAGRSHDANGQRAAPDWSTLWRFAAELGVTFFGAGAAFYANCMKAGLELSTVGDLRKVRALGTTGSPLSEDVQNWGTRQFRQVHATAGRGGDLRGAGPSQGAQAPSGGSEPHAVGERGGDIWWCNISGGTDFAGAFIGGNRELPLVPGEMQCRLLGCAVQAWDENGQPVTDAVGELVCTEPIPSMPLYLWGDTNHERYLSSYFDMYPGVWRHGDWLKVGANGGCVIYGRSDATINRHGLRMGTSELYSAVEALPEVLDSLVVDLEYLGRDSFMPLFVVLREGLALDDALRARINQAIRTALSPRFVPNAILQVQEVPRTLSGKKQELPIKKLLLGQP